MQGAAVTDPFRRIVVSGDHHDGRRRLAENTAQEPVEQVDGFAPRIGPIEHVAGDDQHVRRPFDDAREDAVEQCALVFEQADLLEDPAEVPIRCVEKPHQ